MDKKCGYQTVSIPVLVAGIMRIGDVSSSCQELVDMIIYSYKLSQCKIKTTLRIVCKKEYTEEKLNSLDKETIIQLFLKVSGQQGPGRSIPVVAESAGELLEIRKKRSAIKIGANLCLSYRFALALYRYGLSTVYKITAIKVIV